MQDRFVCLFGSVGSLVFFLFYTFRLSFLLCIFFLLSCMGVFVVRNYFFID